MVEAHDHLGTSSQRLEARALKNVPQSALTTASVAALSSGGVEDLKSSDAAVIENLRTRLNELEEKLRAIGLIL